MRHQPLALAVLSCASLALGSCGSALAERSVEVHAYGVDQQALVIIDGDVAVDGARINSVEADAIDVQPFECGFGPPYGFVAVGCRNPSATVTWEALPPGDGDLTIEVDAEGDRGEVVVEDFYVERQFDHEVEVAPGEPLQLAWQAPGDTLSDAILTPIPDGREGDDAAPVSAGIAMDGEGLVTLTPSSSLPPGLWQVSFMSTPAVTCTGFGSCTAIPQRSGGQIFVITDDT